MDLKQCREEIDKIDKKIVDLFEQRMEICKEVAEYKKNTGKKILDMEREKQKIEAVEAYASNEFNRHGVAELFSHIMSMSRKLQYSLLMHSEDSAFTSIDELPKGKDTKVIFFGTSGSYTEQAMEECFGNSVQRFPAETFREVMAAVKDGIADYGVLPIENTTTGGITDNYDLLVEFDNCIIAEHVIQVEHALLALPDAEMSDIKTVYSHPQAIMQSKLFLADYPEIKIVEHGSTASCAKKVMEDKDISQAAIGSKRAGMNYGLKIMAEHINYEDKNSTRFIIITNKKQYKKGADKVSICFTLPHESGSLYSMLSHIIYNNRNMTKIESRPLSGRPFEYRFFVDFEGSLEEAAVRNTLAGIKEEALELKILGNYKSVVSYR